MQSLFRHSCKFFFLVYSGLNSSFIAALITIDVFVRFSNSIYTSCLKMSEKCGVCEKVITARASKGKVQCKDCNGMFHGSCVNLSQDDVDYMVAENSIWRCPPCQKIRRVSLRDEAKEIGADRVSNEDMIKFLQEMKEELKTHTNKQLKSLEADLGKSVENCHEKITELIKTVSEQSSALKEFEKLFDAMKQENTTLRAKVRSLEQQLDDTDQYTRINCLEINGVPETNNENVVEIVQTIGKVLQVTVSAEDIDACHRLGPKQDGRRRGIIVKFVRRHMKEEMLRKRKIKRNLNTSDIGMASGPAEVVYMNESLSPARRKVLNAARSLRKEQGFTFVWVKNGKVFLRKDEGSKAIMLTNMDQLTDLRK